MAIREYDPRAHHISFAGILITEFASGTFFSCERSVDSFSKVVGAGGSGTRVRSRDTSGSATMTLLSTALVNDALAALLAKDEAVGGGVGALLVEDLNSNLVVFAQEAWIMKPPAIERGLTPGDTVWNIECMDIEIFAGGALVAA